ncbi:hypothetical protein NDU88_005905 [Pleurodeles waltl]|uniref:Uncharacterized protein n=1 Tax=Pleurodeles waltl TaxID=8319 RepID=A0AAV7SN15_PLEWA|nr:hypothetical protein NDU88_005905 [Pleurodeles waltl]
MKPKDLAPMQSNKMDKYAVHKQHPLPSGPEAAMPEAEETSLSAIIAAISALKSMLELKLDAVMADVSFLQADFQKMSDKVSTAETNI